jgi:hypothetical protein
VEETEYYEEDDKERRRRARRRRAWCCCLCLLCCLLILIILLILWLWFRNDDLNNKPTPAPTFAPFVDETDDDYYYEDDIIVAPGLITSAMAPYDFECDGETTKLGYPHVWDQCDCDGEISVVPQDVLNMRQLLIEKLVPKIYDFNYTDTHTSCDPVNMALVWLASGDNRDSGEIRQRFVAALTFFALNGTSWDYRDEWLGELNECNWLGLQCNNRDVINSLALDTNNIFGLVRYDALAWFDSV